MDLDNEIDAVISRLEAGEDPRPTLSAFARAVREPGSVTIEREVCKCSGCGTRDAPCFRCKATSMVGEQGMIAAPLLLAKLGPMVMGWAADRKAKKQAQEAAQGAAQAQARASQASRTPPPPAGRQSF